MKKLLLILTLTFTLSTFAQDRGNGDRIKALKIAFITEQLQLTETEAQQFWPIYNKFEAEHLKLRKNELEYLRDVDFESLSETEAQTLLMKQFETDEKKYQLKKQFITDLTNVLPAKKILTLKASEEAFKRRMMDRLKKHREGFRKDRP